MQLAPIFSRRADGIDDPRERLVLLCRMAGVSFSEVERARGLGRGVISNYVGHRAYAYPRLQEAVCAYLAVALEVDQAELLEYLFPPEAAP